MVLEEAYKNSVRKCGYDGRNCCRCSPLCLDNKGYYFVGSQWTYITVPALIEVEKKDISISTTAALMDVEETVVSVDATTALVDVEETIIGADTITASTEVDETVISADTAAALIEVEENVLLWELIDYDVDIHGLMGPHAATCLAAVRAFGNMHPELPCFVYFKKQNSTNLGSIDDIDLHFMKQNAAAIIQASPVSYVRSGRLVGKLFDSSDENGSIVGINTCFWITKLAFKTEFYQ